jgi:hypothetical protein
MLSLVIFGFIDSLPKRDGIESTGLAHSLIATAMSIWAILEDIFRGIDWPILCDPKPQLVASVLPMISTGYAIFDIIVGIRTRRVDFFLHGVVLFFFCALTCHYGQSPSVSSQPNAWFTKLNKG